MLDGGAHFKTFGMANHFVNGAEAEPGHDFAQFCGDKVHEIDHMSRVAVKVLAQFRILGGHAGGTGIEVADTHHHAAQHHQRRRGKTKFFRAQQARHRHIPPGF